MKRILLILSLIAIAGCEKVEKSNLPYAPVYFVVDLKFKDKELSHTLAVKTFIQPRNAGERMGVGGILVTLGADNIYYAFELCCPHEGDKNVKVEPTEAGTAVCSQCGSVYDIAYGGGIPVSGPSRYQLRRLNLHPSGNELVITF